MSEQTVTASADREELRALIAEVIEVEAAKVTDDAHFAEDLDVDSLMALEITVQIEQRYGIKIDESEVGEITSLAAAYDFIVRKQGAA
jgi:acyl carrier protein